MHNYIDIVSITILEISFMLHFFAMLKQNLDADDRYRELNVSSN